MAPHVAVTTNDSVVVTAKTVVTFDPKLFKEPEERDVAARNFIRAVKRRLSTQTKLKDEGQKVGYCIDHLEAVPRDLAEHEWENGNFPTVEAFTEWFSGKYFIPDAIGSQVVYDKLRGISADTALPKVIMDVQDLWDLNKIQTDPLSEHEFLQSFLSHVKNTQWRVDLGTYTSLEQVLKRTQALLVSAKHMKSDATPKPTFSGGSHKRRPFNKGFKNPRTANRDHRDRERGGFGGKPGKDQSAFKRDQPHFKSYERTNDNRAHIRMANMTFDDQTNKWVPTQLGNDSDYESGKE